MFTSECWETMFTSEFWPHCLFLSLGHIVYLKVMATLFTSEFCPHCLFRVLSTLFILDLFSQTGAYGQP